VLPTPNVSLMRSLSVAEAGRYLSDCIDQMLCQTSSIAALKVMRK